MIEFCKSCRISIPHADITIKSGQSFVSHDYLCPNCRKLANPPEKEQQQDLWASKTDILIKGGKVISE